MFKKITIIITFISINTILCQESFTELFELKRITSDFNGVAYNGKSILVYGDGGIILHSNDGGNKWNQINLNDSFNIIGLINIESNFYGIVKKKYIIRSTNDGITWQQFDFGDDTEFYKILQYNNNLYCLSKSKIYVINQSIEKIKEYPYNTDTSYYDFTITGDEIIYSAGNGKLGKINLQNDNVSFVNLKELGICSDCPVLKNLFSDVNFTYFNYYNHLYQYDDIKIEYIFNPVKSGIFAANNGEVFEIYNITDESINLDSLYFIKIDKNKRKEIQVKEPGNDRYITKLKFTYIKFLSEDTIIAVGKDKLIYMSYNGGKTWQLKSHLPYNFQDFQIYRMDNNNAFFIEPYSKFFKTRDGGNTWLPQKNYDSVFSDIRFKYIRGFGKTFFKDSNFGFFFSSFVLVKDEINFTYTNDGCETVKLKNVNSLIGYIWDFTEMSAIVNSFKTLLFYPGVISGEKYTLIFRFNDTLGIETRTLVDSSHVLFVDNFDNNFLYAIVINYRNAKKNNNNQWTWESIYYSLIRSSDSGVTWMNEMNFNLPNSNFLTHSISKIGQNIIIAFSYNNNDDYTNNDLYILNVLAKELKKIQTFENLSLKPPGIAIYNDTTYIFGMVKTNDKKEDIILINYDIINNPSLWVSAAQARRYSDLRFIVQNDNLLYITGYDSLINSRALWFLKSNQITSLNIQAEILSNLYLSSPKPNPAASYTKIKIWWDQSFDIERADIKAYNIMGQLISDKTHFSFNRINAYSGEFIWNCSGYSTGIYLVRITLGGESRTQAVVINR